MSPDPDLLQTAGTELFKASISVAAKEAITPFFSRWFASKDTVNSSTDIDRKLKTYLLRAFTTASSTRSILFKNEPLPLDEVYEPLNLRCGSKLISSSNLSSTTEIGANTVILAIAGAGKTTLLKHYFLSALREGEDLPLLVELRKINGTDASLRRSLRNTISEDFSEEELNLLLSEGGVTVLLDGYDELDEEVRNGVLSEIISLSDQYHQCNWVLSSRPDPGLSSLQRFTVLTPEPLSLKQSRGLVKRARFDAEVKGKFLAILDRKFYDDYSSFVSNPLLLSIMLLTFSDAGTIEFKKSSFYYDAFLALYNRHDAMKGAFKRQSYSRLPREDLEKVVEAFCMQTFLESKRVMTSLELNSFLQSCKEITGLEYENDLLTKDLTQSYCLLFEEGSRYMYTHRSFEEFFAARFIVRTPERERKDLLFAVTERSIRDNVCVQILYELSPDVVETEIFSPALLKVLGSIASPVAAFASVSYNIWQCRLGHSTWRSGSDGYNFESYYKWIIAEFSPMFPGCPEAKPYTVHPGKLINAALGGRYKLIGKHDFAEMIKQDPMYYIRALETHLEISYEQCEWLVGVAQGISKAIQTRASSVTRLLKGSHPKNH